MSLLIALLIGIAVGAIAGYVFLKNLDYLLINILVGITGAVLGLGLFFFARMASDDSLLSLGGIVSDILGSVTATAIFVVIQLLTQDDAVEKHQ